ncbi:MAG: DUF4132 domain-containing protein [Gemmatimonadaceae bacterium]|nr:DUF4132 domain-containing protein [Gemmatimonadaceae bacterium]
MTDPRAELLEIESRKTEGAVIRRLASSRHLAAAVVGRAVPVPLRKLVDEMFALTPSRRVSFVREKRVWIGEQCASFSEQQWRNAIHWLLPHVEASAVAAAAAVRHRPFQLGWARRPFRCAHSPEVLAAVRGHWLLETTALIGEYDADIQWIAAHAAHLSGWDGGPTLGWLLAGAINAVGDDGAAVFEMLCQSARGEHPTAQMGRHVTQALMSCSRPEAWAFTERLLLSAQREEGLRQVILESADEAHPQMFRRLLRLLIDHDLLRFSSAVRAADVWFGFSWDGVSTAAMYRLLEQVLHLLDNVDARAAAYSSSNAEAIYLALWSTAFDDLESALGVAAQQLASPSADVRFVATSLLAQSLLNAGYPPLVPMLRDTNLQVAARALDAFSVDMTDVVDGEVLLEQLSQLYHRTSTKPQQLASIVWTWTARTLARGEVSAALVANGIRVDADRILPYVLDLEPTSRETFVRQVAGLGTRWEPPSALSTRPVLSPSQRRLMLDLLGDASVQVRNAAFDALAVTPPDASEVDRLVELLSRKVGDIRTNALARLRLLTDDAFLRVVDTLMADANAQRRLAGLELLRDAAESSRADAAVRERLARYANERPLTSKIAQSHVRAAVAGATDLPTPENALGLIDPSSLRALPALQARAVDVETTAARETLSALAELVLAHQTVEVLDDAGQAFPFVTSLRWWQGPTMPWQGTDASLAPPCADAFQRWLRERPATLRDTDDTELLRALVADEATSNVWDSPAVRTVIALGPHSRGHHFLRGALRWCVAWDSPPHAVDFLLDGLDSALATLSDDEYHELAHTDHAERRGWLAYMDAPAGPVGLYATVVTAPRTPVPAWFAKLKTVRRWLASVRWYRALLPSHMTAVRAERLYGLLRVFEERSHGWDVLGIQLADGVPAWTNGTFDDAEFVYHLVGPWSAERAADTLREVSTRKAPRALHAHPELIACVDRVRRRVVEIESQRGDLPTSASSHALALRWTGGIETLSHVVPAVGKAHFARTFGWNKTGATRMDVLSQLVRRSMPRDEDTLDAFAAWTRDARIGEARLVELAAYAPQWAAHVNHVLQWPGLEDAVWWLHAHTKDQWSWQFPEMRERWAAEVSERTPLTSADLSEGAIDVAWFVSAFEKLGRERWAVLDAASKYAASANGHTRAQLCARAMAGLVSRDDLVARIDATRHQDSVRALGLVPLPNDDGSELRARYLKLVTFALESKAFGSMRRESERRAADIGLANLARNAGYADPQRLQWAMEQSVIADLAQGPVTLERDDIRLVLSVDEDGIPDLAITKMGKTLKRLPASLDKDVEVVAFKQRLKELRAQRTRVRQALEEAMARGDAFLGEELRVLLDHPILAPFLTRLVFVGDGIAGYPVEGGRALRDFAGALHVLGHRETVHIAHPHHLLQRNDWTLWQRECFRMERIQPFKQIFRELYPMTDEERGALQSRRFAGHQCSPGQALALLGARGWTARLHEEVSRTFHAEGLTARVEFQEPFFTPADVEGLTLEDITFTAKGSWDPLPLDRVPARVFSEVMRDLDLMVSVAHRGGVDPEATASTVAMRATLVAETCALLGLTNVELKSQHAIIVGTRGTYSVHLGSATVMVLPSTAIPIVAVHAHHRGRIFLPFADADPRTAEVMAKVLMLARDREIRDPKILEWIRAATPHE